MLYLPAVTTRAVDVVVRPLVPADWPGVRQAYLEGIATGQATFEVDAPADFETWSAARLPICRFVAHPPHDEGDVLGWAALSPVSSRPVYRGVAEVGIYVAERARGRGVGRALLARLVEESEAHGIWTLQSSVFPENAATRTLHAAYGFREVGRREKIGRHHGVWRDTLLLERRSRRPELNS